MTYDVEHAFIRLFAISKYSCVKVSDPFKSCFYYLIVQFQVHLYILDNRPLSDIPFAIIFSLLLVISFHNYIFFKAIK